MINNWMKIGCNAVYNPGTIMGRHCTVYPTCNVRGLISENSILKNTCEIVQNRTNE